MKLQFPPGAGVANASATLPYSWQKAASSLWCADAEDLQAGDGRGITLKAAIADALASAITRARRL